MALLLLSFQRGRDHPSVRRMAPSPTVVGSVVPTVARRLMRTGVAGGIGIVAIGIRNGGVVVVGGGVSATVRGSSCFPASLRVSAGCSSSCGNITATATTAARTGESFQRYIRRQRHSGRPSKFRRKSNSDKYDKRNRKADGAATIQAATQASNSTGTASPTTAASTLHPGETPLQSFVRKYMIPVRYRFPYTAAAASATINSSNHYTQLYYGHEQGFWILSRLPLFLAIAAYFTYPDTQPYSIVRIHGLSMLPTMAADGSEVWLTSTWNLWKRLPLQMLHPTYQRGDLIGFAHPSQPRRVSCKRVVGLPGDTVQRYGQYVHLLAPQDPLHWGIQPVQQQLQQQEEADENSYAWIEKDWDERNIPFPDISQEMHRTIVVPEKHVWVEADCPGLGIDSRHFGPIPQDWIRGKIVARLWPIWSRRGQGWSTTSNRRWQRRPHPMPLDDESLMEQNVYRVSEAVVEEENAIDAVVASDASTGHQHTAPQ
jgi:signal peptidase I